MQFLFIFLRGLLMGLADLVPGVSGGTIAFISGIYPRLLGALGALPKHLSLLFKGQIKNFWQKTDATFLSVLLLGIATSILLFSKPISYLLHFHPVLLSAFFLGLVLASAFVVLGQNKIWDMKSGVFCGLGFAAAYLITHLHTLEDVSIAPWYIFSAAMLAICAMILPGISGSFVLLILGVYGPILEALEARDIKIISIFIAGALLGLLSFARVVSYLFKHHPTLTRATLVGFLLGSLSKLWPWKNTLSFRINSKGLYVPVETQSVSPNTYLKVTEIDAQMGIVHKEALILPVLLLIVLGFALVYFVEKFAGQKK